MTKLSSSSKYLLFLIIGLVLVAILLVGYKLLATTSTLPPQSSPAKSPTTSMNTTADWKTYTNTTYKYQFKYPPNFTFQELEVAMSHGLYEGASTTIFEGEGSRIEIAVAEKNEGFELNTLPSKGPILRYNEDLLNNATITRIKINDIDAIRIDKILAGNAGVESEVLLIKVDKIYQIVLTPIDTDTQIFNQILSTFKFNE